MGTSPDYKELLAYMERANQVASTPNADGIPSGLIELIREITGAELCLYFISREESFLLAASAGNQIFLSNINPVVLENIVCATFEKRTLILEAASSRQRSFNEQGPKSTVENFFSIPIFLGDKLSGIIVVINYERLVFEIVQIIGSRLAFEINRSEKTIAEKQQSLRLSGLINLIEQISSTLDRDQILGIIIDYAHKMLNAEGGSLFLVDESSGDLVMQVSTDQAKLGNDLFRVPSGKGIIGHVVNTGETIITNDTTSDPRHYKEVDQKSGLVTRAILAVPLQARTVVLGRERGTTEEKTIGGLEVINKREGQFNDFDAKWLQTLASQVATVLEIAQLYSEANELFVNVIRALSAAIDAKDTYTEGHSQRVSEFSVEIAREINLPAETIYHIQVGCLLHDVGKIGIPDSIIRKPGMLSPEESLRMQEHPSIGIKILREVRLLHTEMTSVAEHHERTDGSGYPLGLKGEQISMAGRIVAVADVFDAMTSDRPYRKALLVEDVFDHLRKNAGEKFDLECVEALICAHTKGRIRTQKDRDIGKY
jgi:putative nucleotidyltransferase with HDIG domain